MVAPVAGAAAQTSLHGLAGFGRRYASSESVKNRKLNHQSNKAAKRQRRRDDDGERARWEREACDRLIAGYVRAGRVVFPIYSHYAYWQGRRCGWDVLRAECREVWWRGWLTVPAEVSPLWAWWSEVPWRQRDQITGEKRKKVSVEATVSLSNPHFQIESPQTYTVED